ncbi:hypothetical protein LPW11_14955 [Geomonas sp. RF6]|uniref:hypothetical protein n=1 Tax=Geomonas sp. RF6 TaxID=2897342 RepID=UPI001E49D8D4|nr:hypothetical protein [Geomonas sp. RF6]UFS69191.1 hypothetical protein LPW11_14955 [Geomonas sp. RF6]
MTEYNMTEGCEEHKYRHDAHSCVWCELHGLRKEISELKLEMSELKRQAKGEPLVRTQLWGAGSHDRA